MNWLSDAINFQDNGFRAPLGGKLHHHLLNLEKERQIQEVASEFTERRCYTDAVCEHIQFEVDADIIKQRWIRDVLKKHGKVTRLKDRQGEIEPWNLIKHTDAPIDEDPFRDSLWIEEDTTEEEEPDVHHVTLEYDEASGLLKVISPEAIIYFNGDKFEDAINIMETLEDMSTSGRVTELLALESLQYSVQWTIEEDEPLFSRILQIKYPKKFPV